MTFHSQSEERDCEKMQENKKEGNLDVSSRKKNLTLDLQPTHTFNLRRSKNDMQKNSAPVLSSPDLHKLDLKTPELENLIMQQNHLTDATPTPNTAQILFPKDVTEEQERYARGFVEALNDLHCTDSSQSATQTIDISNSNSSNSVTTYRDMDPRQVGGFTSSPYPPLGIIIKDEPQTVPSMSDSPNVSPIDMECQEIIKLQRKRMRNRVAASKCRRRKLERIAKLEEKVKLLKGENNELSAYIVRLKDDVCLLKKQVMEHVNRGCQMMSYC